VPESPKRTGFKAVRRETAYNGYKKINGLSHFQKVDRADPSQ
jgi:hypothetical protein